MKSLNLALAAVLSVYALAQASLAAAVLEVKNQGSYAGQMKIEPPVFSGGVPPKVEAPSQSKNA